MRWTILNKLLLVIIPITALLVAGSVVVTYRSSSSIVSEVQTRYSDLLIDKTRGSAAG